MEFKWPSEGGSSSPFAVQLSGQGTGSVSQSVGQYVVVGGVLTFWCSVTVTVGGDGVADVEMDVPGGQSMNADVAANLVDLGTANIVTAGSIAGRNIIMPGSDATKMKFGSVVPITGGDLIIGDVFLLRGSFPVA